MRPIEALAAVVREQTAVYRKGEVVTESDVPADLHLGSRMHVVSIDAFPSTPERGRLIDMHFVNVGFTEAAADRDGFLDALRKALADHGEFSDLDAATLAGGPSYIQLGGWLGDQTLALQFMALCEFHEIGKVLTPATLRLDGPMADKAAGLGWVFVQATVPE